MPDAFKNKNRGNFDVKSIYAHSVQVEILLKCDSMKTLMLKCGIWN